MPIIGYHASHEQFTPSELLTLVQEAERAGFQAAMCSDHLMPWAEAQGHSGFAWSWLGAAMHATALSFGIVNAPGQRYHPVVIAHAAATLAEMFPDRFWISIGSGEALNEHVTGDPWPIKQHRNERLRESAEIMRALWSGETVTHRGHVTVDNARLYSLPNRAPMILGAAITEETARWLGGWADGMITVSQPRETMRAVRDAFRDGGGERKPVYLQVKLSYARSDAEARQGAWEQWRSNVLPSNLAANLAMPDQFEAASTFVRPEDMDRSVRISCSAEQHVEWLGEDVEMGYDRIYLHNVNLDQRTFIGAFGANVLPQITR